MNKKERLKLIRQIISEYKIETQQELVAMLESKGISATQATISRDINNIGIIKVKGEDGSYAYGLSNKAAKQFMSPIQKVVENVIGVTKGSLNNENMLNIDVIPGSTQYLKRLIVEEFSDYIFSIIADDDSLLLVAKTPEDIDYLYEQFKPYIQKK